MLENRIGNHKRVVMPRPNRMEALNDDICLTSVYLSDVCISDSVCLSHTSGLSREQRGLGRLKLVQRCPHHT